MTFLEYFENKICVFDGAMGTTLQQCAIPESAWQDRHGCNEILTLTAPEIIGTIHRRFYEAGADVVETDTFGANALTLGEYGLSDRTEEINLAAARLARRAADEFSTATRLRFVAGSIGPGTKLATLGQVGYDKLYAACLEQAAALLAGGVDLFVIETCQDVLQIKAAVLAAHEAMRATRKIPIYVSVTVETTGTLLIGADMAATLAAIIPLGVDIFGMNCATGPDAMYPHLKYLCENFPGPVGCIPNAGMPRPGPNGVTYPLSPVEMGAIVGEYLRDPGIAVVGGCCGTGPEHIRELRRRADGFVPLKRTVRREACVSSTFQAVTIAQEPRPFIVGERANATGSKAFRDALLADDYDAAFEILTAQENAGAHAADLSVAYAGRDELADLVELSARAARECRLPIMIDSTGVDTVEAALKRLGGRSIVNSINFEEGEARARRVTELAKKYGAALVGLTIDERGMAMTAERKLEVAERLHALVTGEYGLPSSALFIDPLTFTVGSGDATLCTAAAETLEAIRKIKRALPGVWTMLGLSNVSFGLKRRSRKVLNSVFLAEALAAGLDACIINPLHILPLTAIPDNERAAALALLANRPVDGQNPLEYFIRLFDGQSDGDDDAGEKDLPDRERLFRAVVAGKKSSVGPVIDNLLRTMPAREILNEILIGAMKHVGELFGRGDLQLPFVLKAAEAMKRSVDQIEPYMEKGASARPLKMALATVKGDVHDIGKNLVDIILSNNGFKVVNLGTKVPIERIVEAVEREKADVIGLSGLLVKSAMVMAEDLKYLRQRGIEVPVLVGGAALTLDYVENTLQPEYGGAVAYCPDAFAGLKAMQALAEGRIPETVAEARTSAMPRDSLDPDKFVITPVPVPDPPFLGSRVIADIDIERVYAYLNSVALVRGRWGYRRGSMNKAEYDRMMEREIKPKLSYLKELAARDGVFRPQAVVGYYECRSCGNDLVVKDDGREYVFRFPRRTTTPEICIADFFRPEGDIAGFMIATLGGGVAPAEAEKYRSDNYHDYFLLHGLAVEVTDALAEYVHETMRGDLGILEKDKLSWQDYVTQKYRGSRYGFGYPACPDLEQQRLVFELLRPERIGLKLTENCEIDPEVSTSAIVAHHPAAKYFSV